jgi:hypothetical protein
MVKAHVLIVGLPPHLNRHSLPVVGFFRLSGFYDVPCLNASGINCRASALPLGGEGRSYNFRKIFKVKKVVIIL